MAENGLTTSDILALKDSNGGFGGENGFICTKADEFVKVIQDIQKMDTKEITDQASEDIENIYNTQVMAQNYSKLYMKGMERKNKKKTKR